MSNVIIFGICVAIYILLMSIFFTLLLREFHLKSVISRYPNEIAHADITSSANILLPLSKILNDTLIPQDEKQIFKMRPIGYDFVCNHYPATLGNLSEVARRKFSRDAQGLKYLQQQASNLYVGLQFTKAVVILNSVANTYRIMLDLDINKIGDNHKQYSESYRKVLEKTKSRIEEYDIFKAYIELISLETQKDGLSKMNDYEIISFMTFKIWLESFFQSYQYPIDGSIIRKRIDSLIKQINSFIDQKWNAKDFIQNLRLQTMAK